MNRLYFGDNLKILQEHVRDETVDLIYLDPPFNSKASYNILYREPTGEQSEAQITAFDDTWHWTEEAERTYQKIVKTAPSQVVDMISAFRKFINRNDMLAYLTMMTIRLLELHRVLRSSGSIYLHCDPTASHYLKVVMDTIFGVKNFRNEIIWCYSGGGIPKKDFPRKHDIILRYSKSNNCFYSPIYKPYTKGTLERGRTKVKGDRPLREEGTPIPDWWLSNIECDNCGQKLIGNIKRIVSPTDPEKLGYQTQKPVDLLKRVIKTSSPKKAVVLDPFCGCGTTISAAEYLNQKEGYDLTWLGIDITHLAINLIKYRLKKEFGLSPDKHYQVIGEPEDLRGAQTLARQNRFQFEWWALSLVDAKPFGGKKRGADTGIDGSTYFIDPARPKEAQKIVVQVKSGKVQSKDIRDFKGVMEREKSPIGIFITLQKPSRQMATEATQAGFYKDEFPKIQILTIEELLSGKKPRIPPLRLDFRRTTSRVKDVSENLKLLP